MHTTKVLFNLGDGHCLMTARAELDKVYDDLADRIEAANDPSSVTADPKL
jgi:hypothetical protein